MKILAATLLTAFCFGASAAQTDTVATNSFSCMDKTSFEINASCMSNKIETNESFLQAQTMLFEQNANASDNAMATLTIDPKTLNIEVVAHKDAYLAKLLNKQK
ncbi:pyridine nucleotide transhydrogenase [Glaciecola sp. XM2]|jgi:hypothetical protein|uniref:pyridine nucleotide transhydrogenase n=1 Tax=Glaciecola sp. XM2 TaxID=1914931 RepID=UPI001BDEB57B|nr:pyridine nucleotide transhydrogenase [Glaciecola sp. XM2]MBT1451140.1 pyridine nucleotide transhydrogenase [Glaciecola sp. XM2]